MIKSHRFSVLIYTALPMILSWFPSGVSALATSSLPCNDEPDWKNNVVGLSCQEIENTVASSLGNEKACAVFHDDIYNGKSIYEACCFCGGSDELPIAPSMVPSTSPTDDPSSYPTRSPTQKPSVSIHPSEDPSGYPSDIPSLVPSAVPTVEPSTIPSLLPSAVPSISLKPSACENEPNWKLNDTNAECADLEILVNKARSMDFDLCIYFENYLYGGKNIHEACCICGGGDHVPIAPSMTPSVFPTDTKMPSTLPSFSVSPSEEPSNRPSDSPTNVPSKKPSWIPSNVPSIVPTTDPSSFPSSRPSTLPSDKPSVFPSMVPSLTPTDAPSQAPSTLPSRLPSVQPSNFPSFIPTSEPSLGPSTAPSDMPSTLPTDDPSAMPTNEPSNIPSEEPSMEPTEEPTVLPSDGPSDIPSDKPTDQPTTRPSLNPSNEPTAYPSESPSWRPSNIPSEDHTITPTNQPSERPSGLPSVSPSATALPTLFPTDFVCKNNESFEFDLRTCQKIALSDDRLQVCANPEVERNCPIACSVCCEDDELYLFRVNSGKIKSCAWIARAEVRLQYCNSWRNGKMVRLACPKTCNYCPPYENSSPFAVSTKSQPSLGPSVEPSAKSPTTSPTTSPSALSSTTLVNGPSSTSLTCKNNYSFSYQAWSGGKFRSCSNISLKEKRRVRLCKVGEVQDNCPITCGRCCQDDESFRFITNLGKTKPCKWIGLNARRKEKYCNTLIGQISIKEACPVTCDACF